MALSVSRIPIRLASIISQVASEPLFSASVLGFLRYAPSELIDQILSHLPFRNSLDRGGLSKLLKVLLIYGLGKRVNGALNSWALNLWRATAHGNWNWPSELAVVTGGCAGIGRAIVLGLAREGVKVAVLDIGDLPSDMEANKNIYYFKCDVSSPAAVAETSDSIRKSLGNPSILVNNAGIAQSYPILEISDEALHKMFNVNLFALWSTTKAFLPGMIQQKRGHIVNIASLASFMIIPTAADYGAAKAGVLAFHETLNCELKHIYKAEGIMTTIVHPYWVRTNMTRKMADRIEREQGSILTPEQVASEIINQILARRGGQLIIPGKASYIAGIRGWPNWLQELLRDRMGRSIYSDVASDTSAVQPRAK